MHCTKIISFLLIGLLLGCSNNKEHETYEAPPPTGDMMNPAKRETLSPVFIDPSRLQLYGVTTEKVKERNLIQPIRTVGIVNVDERRIYKVQTKVKGWIDKLYVDFTNKPVPMNAPLFSIYSPELYATQEEYILASKSAKTSPEGMFAEQLNKSNQELLQATEDRLLLWDVPKEEIQRLQETQKPSYALTFYSPVHGIVLDKNAYYGLNVGPGIDLFTIADLSWIWVIADVYEQDISLMKLGQEVDFTITALPAMHFKGKISFINYVLDSKTRTVKVRIDVDNLNYLLKPDMYGVVEIKVDMGMSLAIPQDAVIDTGLRKIVFIDEGQGHFTPREVKLGYLANGYFQVLSGVSEGETVVTSSQFLLDSESRIGGKRH